MHLFERFCNWLNMIFLLRDIPDTSRSILKDLMTIGIIPEEDGWKLYKEK